MKRPSPAQMKVLRELVPEGRRIELERKGWGFIAKVTNPYGGSVQTRTVHILEACGYITLDEKNRHEWVFTLSDAGAQAVALAGREAE